MTRGRTGSTAVMDELNKSQAVCALQELFMQGSHGQEAELEFVYSFAMPFDLWKAKKDRPGQPPAAADDEARRAARYLSEVESQARRQGAQRFGFKVLSHHLDERPYLGRLLKQRKYRVIYLTRNPARQVISGMVANERGVFGVPKDFEDARRYRIDVDDFERRVQWEREAVEKERVWLAAEGFRFVEMRYEDFVSDRAAFYDRVFRFLGLSPELPPPSDWGIAIKDLRKTIKNYKAVVERAAAIGAPIDI
jgi:LPS sulfotransferase NodH